VITFALAVALSATGLGGAKGRADLVVTSVSKPPASIERTGGFDVTVKVKNSGRGSARVSATGIYLSTIKRKDRRAIALRPSVGIPRLRGRRAYQGVVTVRVPASAAKASYYLIACADDGRKVRERRETNNCRTATARIRVTAAVQPPAGKTSSELIDAAVKSGRINPSLGTAYKVFAAFADPRLPSEYRGAAPPSSELVLRDAGAKFDSLAPSAQDLIRPYFVGPFHAGSWWARINGVGGTAQGSSFRAPAGNFLFRCGLTKPLSRWGHVDTANGKARVWWETNRPADATRAKTIAAAIDQPIWTKLFDLMKKEPISDDGDTIPCRGGDDRLDVAIVYMPNERWEGLTTPLDLGCGETPEYVLVKSNAKHLLATVAHELMHAYQFAFKISNCGDFRWFEEATATWAEDYVYPDDQDEHDYAGAFLEHPSRPLEYDPNQDDLHKYGAYLFPFYLARVLENPSLIGTIWANAGNKSSLDAIDGSIPGGFKGQWHKFVLANWNKPPVDTYRQRDNLEAFPATSTPDGNENDADVLVELQGGGDVSYKFTGSIDHLSARYVDFEFEDQTARSIDFWDGFSGGDPALKVRALVKIQNQDWTVEDWSGRDQGFCRDLQNERVEELVLIFSNSNFSDRTASAPLGFTELTASNVGCWQWAGSITAQAKYVDTDFNQSETSTTTGVLFRRLDRHAVGGTDFYIPVTGNATWTHSGTYTTEFKTCSGQLSGTYAIPPATSASGGSIQLAGYVGSSAPPEIAYRQYAGGLPMPWEFPPGFSLPSISYDCSDGSTEFFSAFTNALWLTRAPPEGAAPAVSADGMHLNGTYTFTSGPYQATYTWQFASQPQN